MTLISDTIAYADFEQGRFLKYTNERLLILKESQSLKFTILAYKGLIARTKNTITAIKEQNPNVDTKIYNERITRYEKILVNFQVITTLPNITDTDTFQDTLSDLRSILRIDIAIRGVRDTSLQVILSDTVNDLGFWATGIGLTSAIKQERNLSDSEAEVKLLQNLRVFLLKIGYNVSDVDDLIERWKQPPINLKTVVWALYYDTTSGYKKGLHQEGLPAGTYVLFNVVLSTTTPEMLFGTMLNQDKEDSKDNIYYWFKRKFPPVSEKEWGEKKKFLVLDGWGYISETETEEKIKTRYNTETQQYEQKKYTYPIRIPDKIEFQKQYTAWKELWKRRLNLTEAGWQDYVHRLNPYL